MDKYYWVKGKLVINREVLEQYNNCYCLDPKYSGSGRFGMFTSRCWVDCKYEDFPAEFRMNLLLLGVS